MSSQPGLRRGCGAAGAKGRSWGLWCRPMDTTETAAGSSTEVSERTPLPPAAGMRPQQTGSQAPGLFFVMRGQRAGRGGQQSGTAGSLSRYLFSMFCICKLREVKLASRSVTSSTCGKKPKLCEGVPRISPDSTTGVEAGTVSSQRL